MAKHDSLEQPSPFGDQPPSVTTGDSVMLLDPQWSAGYAAGVADEQARYRSLVEAAKGHGHRSVVSGLWIAAAIRPLVDCAICEALRQLEVKP